MRPVGPGGTASPYKEAFPRTSHLVYIRFCGEIIGDDFVTNLLSSPEVIIKVGEHLVQLPARVD